MLGPKFCRGVKEKVGGEGGLYSGHRMMKGGAGRRRASEWEGLAVGRYWRLEAWPETSSCKLRQLETGSGS